MCGCVILIAAANELCLTESSRMTIHVGRGALWGRSGLSARWVNSAIVLRSCCEESFE